MIDLNMGEYNWKQPPYKVVLVEETEIGVPPSGDQEPQNNAIV